MSEPLDLESIKERLYVTGWPSSGDRTNDFDALLAEVERLRGEVARQAEQITAVRATLPERCENYTSGDCQSAGRDMGSPYGAYGYCQRCRVVAALDGGAS